VANAETANIRNSDAADEFECLILTVRTGSSRLPGKCLLPFSGTEQPSQNVLEHMIARSRGICSRTVVCTTTDVTDDVVEAIAKDAGIECFRGSRLNKVHRWFTCLEVLGIGGAHMLDVDDPFFSADEVRSSLRLMSSLNQSVFASYKSSSGNASVGCSLLAGDLHEVYLRTQHREELEMVESFFSEGGTKSLLRSPSSDPLPEGTRLTLDYYEDYLALGLLKVLTSDTASREEIHRVVCVNPWILELNSGLSKRWKERQDQVSRSENEKFA
jgi:spore coat polysaccharide biosynthesis protein SpsF (cytidylyltransferase family)